MSDQHTPDLVQERDAFKGRLAEQQGELFATKLELSRLRSILNATHWACQGKTL